MTAPADDDWTADALEYRRLTDDEGQAVREVAREYREELVALLAVAAIEMDSPVEHIRAMAPVYDRLAALDSDITATMLIAELWPEAIGRADLLRERVRVGLAALPDVGANYRGRRRMCECIGVTGYSDPWRCPQCGGQRVRSGGTT